MIVRGLEGMLIVIAADACGANDEASESGRDDAYVLFCLRCCYPNEDLTSAFSWAVHRSRRHFDVFFRGAGVQVGRRRRLATVYAISEDCVTCQSQGETWLTSSLWSCEHMLFHE